MSRTITALFDKREDAEAGCERLSKAGINGDSVQILDQTSAGYSPDRYSDDVDPGMWGNVRNAYLPAEDRHAYEEAVRRGGFVLTADVEKDKVEKAVAALEDTDSIDIDDRSGQWKQEGWKPAPPQGARAQFGDDTIPIAEEKLVVGKREVEHGGMRVRSYVTEKPVHEQIKLRQEHVEVERRKVDRPLSGNGDAFQERTIEMSETSEEAVVGKEGRVVEEVSLKKTAEDRTEEIDETVRKTEVEVEKMDGKGRQGTSFGAMKAKDAMQPKRPDSRR